MLGVISAEQAISKSAKGWLRESHKAGSRPQYPGRKSELTFEVMRS